MNEVEKMGVRIRGPMELQSLFQWSVLKLTTRVYTFGEYLLCVRISLCVTSAQGATEVRGPAGDQVGDSFLPGRSSEGAGAAPSEIAGCSRVSEPPTSSLLLPRVGHDFHEFMNMFLGIPFLSFLCILLKTSVFLPALKYQISWLFLNIFSSKKTILIL